jgi:dsRNA-specific ribonuclease
LWRTWGAKTIPHNKPFQTAQTIKENAPEVVSQVFIPKVIAKKYPDLTEDEVEEIRQAVVAGGVFKSPSAAVEHGKGDTKFVRMAEKLINIDDLTIDLIDKINPFQRAYEILSKSVDAEVLKTIHGAISLTKIAMTEEEAVQLFPRIKVFKAERGAEPSLTSANPMERRLAEALAWLRDAKRRKMSGGAEG